MKTEDLVTLEILPNKKVQVLITTVYYVEDEELTRKNFRIALEVGDYDKAREYLDEAHMRILELVWE
jgi:hypothetical protein